MIGQADSPSDPAAGSVVLRSVPGVVIHHAPHQLQVRLGGDVDAERAGAAARRVAAPAGEPTFAELDLSRATHVGPDAVARIAATLTSAPAGLTQLVLRVRPGPVVRLVEAAGLAEEDGGPATILTASAAVRPPDAATEVVMRFYEALAGRDWLGLHALVADDARWSVPTIVGPHPVPGADEIVDFHARAVHAIPGVLPAVGSTESDGRTVLVRGSHVVPARGSAAAPFRHRWHVAGEQLVGFREQVDADAYGHLQALHRA